jgi:predicted glycoside hydrolase/deacetylase ChbG (UPF0249 family)
MITTRFHRLHGSSCVKICEISGILSLFISPFHSYLGQSPSPKAPSMIRGIVLVACSLLLVLSPSLSQTTSSAPTPELLVRCDDAGLSHAVNQAFQQLAETGFPFSASVMTVGPWFAEAAQTLKQYPNVSIGVHLTLNAEWKELRWGPILGNTVPSLVDSLGYFFPSRAALMAHNPKLDEVERELRAQIDRALAAGLKPDYIDYHMGAAVGTPELRAIVERLASEYHAGISRYFGEEDAGSIYRADPEAKTDSLLAIISRLKPDKRNLLVFHITETSSEMSALTDLNAIGLSDVGKHREAEFLALCSPDVHDLFAAKGVRLLTYADLVRDVGLARMKRP